MYQLEKLQENEFEEVWEIMEASFPVDERRTKEGQKDLMKKEEYSLYGYRKEGRLAAFFAIWEFAEFVFIEHFAVREEARNGGIGAKLLQQVLGQQQKMVILEVELPETELACRRIGFYERNGFVQNGYPYVQPALSEAAKPIALQIMSMPSALDAAAFEKVRDTLYRRAYHVENNIFTA